MVKPLVRFVSSISLFVLMALCLSITNPNNVVFAADHSGDASSSWTGALESLSRSSSIWTTVLQEGEVPAAQVLDNFRAQNEHVEAELFSRIRNLKNRLIDRLPPQLNHGEYATLVRDNLNLNEAINIRNYHSALSNEIFDITVLELKANLQDQLFNLLLSEPDDRLIQILGESHFPERAIRREALEYIELKMGAVNLNLENARSHFDKVLVEQRHSYHLVDPSPWPILGSLGALATTVGGVMYMHSFQGGARLLSLGLIFLLYTMFVWWRDVLHESTLEGHHTKVVQLGLRYGFILFIVSEVMFFFAFFWASSHSSLAPTVEIGGIWPPKGIGVLDPWEIPFLNTPILLSSGAAVTWAHHAILVGKEKRAVYALVATVFLALVFTGFQGMEYYQAPFTISDSIYGSTFFLATGFHGFHVIIGTLFLIICGIRQYLGHLTKEHHVGFEAAAWYWHFVDVVRLFPFVSIYWWREGPEKRSTPVTDPLVGEGP
ncbi:hypothetical protein PVK06_007200 [Gossypium arboreum]|uniref:Cytochrome c oxidase subunit 3 n=1 Tax=Gossypium arboreum TaxID=29729 RepID=A0ABR0QGN9_GOSAR|nr:hypothetical protein PVK06_007200 [Gossypium arboreum]